MKKLRLSLLLITSFLAAPSPALGDEVSVKPADFLTPADLGATKFILTAKVEKGQVAIFTKVRKTTGIPEDVYHVVRYGVGEHSQSVCALNPDYFRPRPDGKEIWHLAAYGGSGSVPGRLIESSYGGEEGSLLFKEDEKISTLFTFKVFVISFEAAQKVYKGLPSAGPGGWEWSGKPQ